MKIFYQRFSYDLVRKIKHMFAEFRRTVAHFLSNFSFDFRNLSSRKVKTGF